MGCPLALLTITASVAGKFVSVNDIHNPAKLQKSAFVTVFCYEPHGIWFLGSYFTEAFISFYKHTLK